VINVKDISIWSHPTTIEYDGRTYTYKSVVDEDSSIMDDGDWCGELEWSKDRPDAFNGNAEIIKRDRRDNMWWQPPADVKRGTESFTNLRRFICDALDYGYVGVVVEDQDGNTESIWGFVWSDDEAQEYTVVELIETLHAAYLADRATWGSYLI